MIDTNLSTLDTKVPDLVLYSTVDSIYGFKTFASLQLWQESSRFQFVQSIASTGLRPSLVDIYECFPCGRRVQTTGQEWYKLCKKIKTVEFHDHIWNQHEKYIEISTNMSGMGSVIHELAVKIWDIWESKHNFAQ